MADKSQLSLYQEQKKIKPKVEDVINDLLSGDRKQAALDFVAFIKSYRMTPQWASANSWAVSYKGKRVCYIKVSDYVAEDGSWYIRPSVDYNDELFDFIENEKFTEIIWDNLHYCRACGRCAPGRRVTVCGREFDHVCHGILFEFHNPDTATLDCAKKLVDFRRDIIAGNM
jgi:hypothetical protein